MTYLVLIREETRKSSWERLLAYRRAGQAMGAARDRTTCLRRYDAAGQIAVDESILQEDFQEIGAFIEEQLEARQDVTILADGVVAPRLNALTAPCWETLLARLILAYPEVEWMFSETAGSAAQTAVTDDFFARHGVQNLFRPRLAALFDGSGLRDWVRARAIADPVTKRQASHLPRREHAALALDEESGYAQLHAYTAYRFGYQAFPVTSFAAATYLLSSPPALSCRNRWHLVFEDIYANFPDGKPGVHKLYVDANSSAGHFRGRAAEWPRLEECKTRTFITAGHREAPPAPPAAVANPAQTSGAPQSNETYIQAQKNEAYIQAQKNGGIVDVRELSKPHAGMFQLWNAAALGFQWPPSNATGGAESGHSSPGALLFVAQRLLLRAAKLFGDSICVEDAVRGAVLATEALELLGGKTPTVSVEALTLKHQFEAKAECQFSGVEYHLNLEPRLREIERDSEHIGQYFHPDRQASAVLNVKMMAVSSLVEVFREYSQFDEELACINQTRHLHNQLWLSKDRWHGLGRLFVWYVEKLLKSSRNFGIAILAWIVVFTLLFIWAGHYEWHEWQFGLEDSVSSFFSIGGPIHQKTSSPEPLEFTGYPAVVCAAIFFGFIHLGLFISYLYSILFRK